METVEDLLVRGEQLGAEGKWEEALSVYEKVVELDQKNWLAHEYLGDIRVKTKELDKAICSYFHSMNLYLQYPLLLKLIGLLKNKGQLTAAIADQIKADYYYFLEKAPEKQYSQNNQIQTISPTLEKVNLQIKYLESKQKSVIDLDLRRPITGSGWYKAEDDGRWTGPENHSSLVLPYPQPGEYVFEMKAISVMSLEILQSLKLYINDLPVEFQYLEQVFPPKLPVLINGKFVIADNLKQPFLGIDINVSHTSRPHNSKDPRSMGIKIDEIKIIPV